MKNRIKKGDRVRVVFASGGTIDGTVDWVPNELGGPWVIVQDGGPVAYVQTYEMIHLLAAPVVPDERPFVVGQHVIVPGIFRPPLPDGKIDPFPFGAIVTGLKGELVEVVRVFNGHEHKLRVHESWLKQIDERFDPVDNA